MSNFKKIFFVFSFLLVSPVFAKDFSFSLEPFFQLSFGKMGEYIYGTDGDLVSYLDWETKPLCEAGVEFSANIKKFSFSAETAFGLPFDCGKMRDCDYGYSSKYPDGFTYQYSENPETAKFNFDSTLKASYNFQFWKFSLIPSVQFQYKYNSFKTHNGYGWYGNAESQGGSSDIPYDDPEASYYNRLYPVEYLRHSFFTWLGGNFSFSYKRFSIGGGFFVSPYSFDSSIDYHHGVMHPFYTLFINHGIFERFKWEAFSQYFFTNKIGIKISAGGIFGAMKKIDHYVREGTEDQGYSGFEKTSQKCGSDIFIWNLRLSAIILL